MFLAVTPDGTSVYVTSSVEDTILQYTVDPSSGALRPKRPPAVAVARGTEPLGIAVTPNGKSAYVAAFNNDIVQYDIDPKTGALSPKSPPTVAIGGLGGPVTVAVTPDGKSAYVSDQGGNTVLQYDINSTTGNLSPKVPATVSTGSGPYGVAVAPDGKSVYVTNRGNGTGLTLSEYNVDPLTGTLSPKVPATVPTGMGPVGIAVTPDGRSVYVTNFGSPDGRLPFGNTLSQYDVDPLTGALSPKTPAIVATGTAPQGIAVTPDGKRAYVTDVVDDTISQYSINALTGALSPTTPATVATGSGPSDVVVGPLGASSGPVTITTSSLPPGTVGQPYSVQLEASGGTPPYSWNKYLQKGTGTLPRGVSLSPSGLISGTPKRAGTYTITVKCLDSSHSHKTQATQTLTLTINP
jgi:DNA-binding beta-propeller fold protein YncE